MMSRTTMPIENENVSSASSDAPTLSRVPSFEEKISPLSVNRQSLVKIIVERCPTLATQDTEFFKNLGHWVEAVEFALRAKDATLLNALTLSQVVSQKISSKDDVTKTERGELEAFVAEPENKAIIVETFSQACQQQYVSAGKLLSSLDQDKKVVQLDGQVDSLISATREKLSVPVTRQNRLEMNRYGDMYRLLLKHSKTLSGEEGAFGLLWAAKRGYSDCAIALIEKGVPVDVVDEAGKTPLILAVNAGRADLVLRLLEKKADIFKRAHDGECAFHLNIDPTVREGMRDLLAKICFNHLVSLIVRSVNDWLGRFLLNRETQTFFDGKEQSFSPEMAALRAEHHSAMLRIFDNREYTDNVLRCYQITRLLLRTWKDTNEPVLPLLLDKFLKRGFTLEIIRDLYVACDYRSNVEKRPALAPTLVSAAATTENAPVPTM
jgi:hypothetical protein